jgi:hypothetical protein
MAGKVLSGMLRRIRDLGLAMFGTCMTMGRAVGAILVRYRGGVLD